MTLFSSLILLLGSLHTFASDNVDISYTKGDYGSVYHESSQKILFNTQLGSAHKFYLGYEHADRDYTSDVGFYRDALLIGDTIVFKDAKSYIEFFGAWDEDTLVGPQFSASVIPHTSYFTKWDLSLGFHYAKYDTGEVQSFQPQVIYFLTDTLSLGHGSWLYEDNGWHHAHREFFRGRWGVYSTEISWSGGENREDIGLIDSFNSYGISISYFFKKKSRFYLSLEDYQGQIRRGSQWGTGLQWAW